MSPQRTPRPRITLRGFKPGAPGITTVLGELETAVMEALWAAPGQTVTDVEERLRKSRTIARTTALTTLDRLHRKGYLIREKQGKAFVYAPRLNRHEFERATAEEFLSALLGDFNVPALSAFVDLVSEDPTALDRLDEIIQAKRSQRGRRA